MMRNDHTFFFPERPNASKCNPPPLRAVLIPPILCRSVDCHVAVMLVTTSSGHVNNCSPTKFSVRAPDPSANITFTAYGKYGQRSVRTPATVVGIGNVISSSSNFHQSPTIPH